MNASIPAGWRLVPDYPTSEWIVNIDKMSVDLTDQSPGGNIIAKVIRLILLAAPKAKGVAIEIGPKPYGVAEFFAEAREKGLTAEDLVSAWKLQKPEDFAATAVEPPAIPVEALNALYIEQDRRFNLPRDDDDYLCSDDTQVGVEFAFNFLSKYAEKQK